MKRTPIKRGSKPLKRKPLKKRGRRSARDAEKLNAFRGAVLARAQWPAGVYVCESCCQWASLLDAHHLINRARAPSWPDLHNPDINGMALCRSCHSMATLNPEVCGDRYLRAWRAWRDWAIGPTH